MTSKTAAVVVPDDTQTIPVITEEMIERMNTDVDKLMAEAERRFQEQVKASEAMYGVEKVKILLAPLMRDAIFTDDEMKALVAMRSILDSAQERISDVHHDNVPILDVPTVPRQEGKDFNWGKEEK